MGQRHPEVRHRPWRRRMARRREPYKVRFWFAFGELGKGVGAHVERPTTGERPASDDDDLRGTGRSLRSRAVRISAPRTAVGAARRHADGPAAAVDDHRIERYRADAARLNGPPAPASSVCGRSDRRRADGAASAIATEELEVELRNNQEADGHVGGYANWLVYTPGMLYAVAQNYLLSNDRAGFERLLPQGLAAMDWCLGQIARASQAEGPAHGLVRGPLNDGTGQGIWAFNQAYLFASLRGPRPPRPSACRRRAPGGFLDSRVDLAPLWRHQHALAADPTARRHVDAVCAGRGTHSAAAARSMVRH